MEENIKLGLFRVIEILEDYLPQVVFAGGWAPLLYYHYLVQDKDRYPLLTREFDLMVRDRVDVVDRTIDELLEEAGLHAEPYVASPDTAFFFSGEIEGFTLDIEFFTPKVGRGSEGAIEVQDGLLAQPLRFADILISNAIEIAVDDHPLASRTKPVSIMVPSPAAYIFNKGLTYRRRQREVKKGKDLYYIFDILARCPELREGILEGLDQLRQDNEVYSKWFSAFVKNLRQAFLDINTKEVAMVSKQRSPQAFVNLNDDQFRQYVFRTFMEFIDEVEKYGA